MQGTEMKGIVKLAALLATLGLALSLSGTAQSGAADENAAYAKLKALLPPGPNAKLCLSRNYDARHMKRHPKQTVTKVVLYLRYVPLSDADATLVSTENGGTEKRAFRYDFTLAATVKGKGTYYAAGDCASAEGIGCGVDCDGGGIEIEPLAGKESVLMRLERIRMTPGCEGEGSEVDLEGGEDDKVFKLGAAPLSVCKKVQKILDTPVD